MRLFGLMSAAVLSIGLCSNSFGQITGKVMLDGEPPEMPQIKAIASTPTCAAMHKNPVFEDTVVTGEKGELANVIVFIAEEKPGELKGPQKKEPAVLDQKGCVYTPHVVAVQVGQPVVVKNSDPFMHNVHSLAIDNPSFNFAQVTAGDKKLEPFTAVETFQIKCDVHPWMKAIVRVFDNPYFAVTGEDGKFAIDTKGLKDGTYSVQAWHEKYHDSAPQKVEVKDGKAGPIEFKFKSSGGKAQAAPLKSAHFASLPAGKLNCCSAAPVVAAAK